jgi:pilus assembly protein Flp/PilA
MKSLFRILRETKGATSVEYGLILALIFLAMLVSLRNVATATTDMWNNVSNTVANG